MCRVNSISYLFLILFLSSGLVKAQETILVPLADIELWATEIEQGDCDTYGKGYFECRVTASVKKSNVILKCKIRLLEQSGDHTILTGTYRRVISVPELEKYSACKKIKKNRSGTIKGRNFGARGFRHFNGKGLIKSGYLRTDTFGCDNGKAGGRIKLHPLILRVHCHRA